MNSSFDNSDILNNQIACKESRIINLIEGDLRFVLFSIRLKFRWMCLHQGNHCERIEADRLYNMNNINQLDGEGGKLQLYIIAHADSGNDYIEGSSWENKKFQLKYDELAQRLHEFIGDRDVVINLIACSAARGKQYLDDPENKNISNSFAAKLHNKLSEIRKENNKNNIPVIARTQDILINPLLHGGKKYTGFGGNIFNFQHQRPGSKVVFLVDENGSQTVKNVCYKSLLDRVLFFNQKQVTSEDNKNMDAAEKDKTFCI